MEYYKETILKDGRKLILRSGEAGDGRAVLINFKTTHAESDYLTTYPEECTLTEEKETAFLERVRNSERNLELLAIVDGRVVGTAGVDEVGDRIKTRHRASYGVAILKEYWGLGIGRAATEAAIECAKKAGYTTLELEVVEENSRAVSLYSSLGFVRCGRNPYGFRNKEGRYQPLISMILKLEDE